jgi:hypothetical protein
MLLALSTLLPIGVCLFRKRKGLGAYTTLLWIGLITFVLSCGGGGTGGGTSAGGGTPPPLPPPTTPVTKTEIFTLTLRATNFTKSLGTVSVKVTK